jgi:cytochrome c oxidase cbb3-type subunit 1
MKSEMTPTDAASRPVLLLLLASGILWLIAASVLGIIASIQLNAPQFLSGCPVLTYGRMTVLAETAFVYGWLANAGLAMVLWVLGRLAGEPLRGQNWAIMGAAFWNLGVTGALAGVAVGDATGFSLLGLPSYVQLLLLFSYASIAIPGVLAWSGRLREVSFASHWYGAAALLVFPWVLSIAHVMLFAAPARGVIQAITAGWYAQETWTLWLAPMALSAAYYVVPKMTGRVLPSYEFASLGFWCLVVVGGLTGGRHLLGGPVPAWIPSVAVVSCALLLFHYLVVLLNLRGAFSGRGASLKFIAFGVAAYAAGGLADAATCFHAVAIHTQFTHADEALKQLSLYAAASMLLFGAIYFALPRISGKQWYSGGLVGLHLFLSAAGIVVLVGALAAAGLGQGRDLLDPMVPFADIARHARPWIVAATAARVVLLAGNLIFLLNFYLTVCMILKVSKPAEFAPAGAMEAPAP